MITMTAYCLHCGSDVLVAMVVLPTASRTISAERARGKAGNIQRPHAYPKERREEILRSYEERSSLRGRQPHGLRASRHTVIAWIKKAAKRPSMSETLIEPDVNNAEARVLELEELWSFVRKQA